MKSVLINSEATIQELLTYIKKWLRKKIKNVHAKENPIKKARNSSRAFLLQKGNKMNEGLHITREGRLIQTYWFYNDDETIPKKERGKYLEKDVTDSAIRRLWDDCTLEDGVTLKSIFTLLNSDIDLFDLVIGNWCKEIVTEGLTQTPGEYSEIYDPDGIEYLELYWSLARGALWNETKKAFDSDITELQGTKRANFHGIGYELKENKMHDWKNKDGTDAVEWAKGCRIPWGMSFTAANAYINYPVKLAQKMIIDDEVERKQKSKDSHFTHSPVAIFERSIYTLGDIFYGIIWELSFHGGPKERIEKSAELKESIDKIRDGSVKTVSWEEMLKELGSDMEE